MDNKKIIRDFLEFTPAWLKALKKAEEISGFGCCPFCGMKSKNMKNLLKALKEVLKNEKISPRA